MPKVEHLPQSAFALVSAHHRSLEAHGIADHFLYHHRIAIENLAALVFEEAKQTRISNDAALQRLVEPGAIFARRQSFENDGIDEHHTRLMKSSKQILARHKIDGRFTADRRI